METMGLDFFKVCGTRMKVEVIKLTVKYSRERQRRLLPQLATYINDPELLVSAAAINAYRQLFTNIEPDMQAEYIPDVLPVLHGVVCDYQKSGILREIAAAAMIIICMNHLDLDVALPSLSGTVAALLEARASSRSWLEGLKTDGGNVNWDRITEDDNSNLDSIERHNTIVNKSIMPLIHFKRKLPRNTWAQIESSLSQEQRDEFELIWNSVLQGVQALALI